MQKKIEEAVKLLLNSAQPQKIILFGSQAKGESTVSSDIDLMVIIDVTNRIKEAVRLRRILSPLRMSFDIIVVSKERFEYWRETPGNVYFEADTEGQVLYDEAA